MKNKGLTVWLTGLSGAGKSTIAETVHEALSACGIPAEMLDADQFRKKFSPQLGFSKEERDQNVRRLGFVADLLTRHGVVVLVAAISPYRFVRDEIRQSVVSFLEVYVVAPIELCEQRDVKGLYKKARAGMIQGFTGIDDPYEPPLRPEVICETDRETLEQSSRKVLDAIFHIINVA